MSIGILPPEVTIATKPSKQTKAKSPSEPARDLAIAIARLAGDMHCRDVVVLDVRHLSPVTDYFVLATGTSTTQLRACAYSAAEVGADHDYKPLAMSGDDGGRWIVIDFVHVVMHVFNEESRQFYDLDALWGDAPKVPWEAKATKRIKATKAVKPAPSKKSGTSKKPDKLEKPNPARARAPRAKKTKASVTALKSRHAESRHVDDQTSENASE